jgi:hypothetical protein
MEPFRIPPAVGQFSHDAGGCAFFELAFFFVHNGGGGRNDASDVLQNEEPRTASVGEVNDAEEEAASPSVKPGAAAGDGQVLAREASNDRVHASTKLLCWNASKIAAPHRRCIQESCFHERNQLAGCRGFPLAIGHCSQLNAKMVERSSDSFIEHADAGAKADRIDDGTSHTQDPSFITDQSTLPVSRQ